MRAAIETDRDRGTPHGRQPTGRAPPPISVDDLINAASFVPKERRFTCHWDQDNDGRISGDHELTPIDHILLAPELAQRVTSATIANAYDPAGVSDHSPMVVTIKTKSAR